MCGIFGVVSSATVTKTLLSGLKKLEYRGYDSAGLSIINNENKLKRIRCSGKVNDLKKLVNGSDLSGSCGIAHTRWATHGLPNTKNSHPHNSGKISVVHNGIIENHEDLKSKLKKLRYRFLSETDSEVIAHLIHSYISKNNTFFNSVLKALKDLKGSYALGILDEENPSTIIAASHGSPLLVGIKFV